MSRIYTTKKGRKIVLRNPYEKSRKYATELKTGYIVNQKGNGFAERNGSKIELTDIQKAYRGGYLKARSDNSKAYKYNKKKGR